MIYLNNAATTFPKPQCVLDVHAASLALPPVSQFRSSDSVNKEDVFEVLRSNLGRLLHIMDTKRIYFTSGATDSLNIVIRGLKLSGKKILTTRTEHNSVLRPLYNFLGQDRVRLISCDRYGKVKAEDIEAAITPDCGAVLINHCSNVTGMVQDLAAIGKIAGKYGLIFIVDASQSAGCIPIDTTGWNIDVLIFTGHKSLFGPPGTGGYYIREGIDLLPGRFGGTGKDSLKLTYEENDYEYEVGTQNFPGIMALNAGVDYILKRGLLNIEEKEYNLIQLIYKELGKMSRVTLYGTQSTNRGPVVSFNINGLRPSETAYILQNGYEIIVRTGFHCAPLIHESLKTEKFGTVRASISDLTQEEEAEQFIEAIGELQSSLQN